MGRTPILRPCGCRTSKQIDGSSANHLKACPLSGTVNSGPNNSDMTQAQIITSKNLKTQKNKARKLQRLIKTIRAFDISDYDFIAIPKNNAQMMNHIFHMGFRYSNLKHQCVICKLETSYAFDRRTLKAVICESCLNRKVTQ